MAYLGEIKIQRSAQTYKIAAMAVLLAGACFLTYYCHAVIKTDLVFTHLFYVPIFLASFWWKRKGLIVAVLLGALLVLSHNPLGTNVATLNDCLRAFMLIIVGAVVAKLSERIAKVQKERELYIYDLGERVKELSCLHGLSKLAEQKDLTLEGIFQKITGLIRNAWQYPEITCASVVLDDKEYKTSNFWQTQWLQSADILVHGKKSGTIEVYYREKRQEIDEGPFLKEERDLIDALAERLGRIVERKLAQQERNKLLHDMAERIKELDCVYKVANSIRKHTTLEAIFRDVVMFIPPGWHYPEITRAKICFDGKQYVSEHFEKTDWRLTSDIIIKGQKRGSVEVYYMEERPVLNEGPFLKEERHLIDSIAQALSESIEHKLAEEQAHQAELFRISRLNIIGEMASGLAHELNQPLCAILSCADLCLRATAGEIKDIDRLKGDLQVIETQAERAGNIIQRIRALVKKQDTQRSDVDINGLIRETLSFIDTDIRRNEIKLSLELSEQMPKVTADTIQIEQVLLNLLRNAIEALAGTDIEKRSLIIQTTRDSENVVKVVMRDSGDGLTAEVEKQLFNPFFTTKPDGLGVGLSISYSIIEAHHGELWAKSNPDHGSTFGFTLPVAKTQMCAL